MRKKIVMANWKMNGSLNQINSLINDIILLMPDTLHAHCAIFPPSVYLPCVSNYLKDTAIGWGAQNVYPADAGAFTGELSAPMLLDYNCKYVLVGHSERRRLFHEDEKFVAEKFHHAKDHGIIPVVCIGETLTEREQGLTEQVLSQQLLSIAQDCENCFTGSVIAYEPIWAIGTGQSAKPEQVQAVHHFIREYIAQFDKINAKDTAILYGGSVNETNAQTLFAMPDVDGGLVGGASMHARQFVEIVKCIS